MNHFQCPCGFAGMRFAWHCACGEHPDVCDETCACGLPRPAPTFAEVVPIPSRMEYAIVHRPAEVA